MTTAATEAARNIAITAAKTAAAATTTKTLTATTARTITTKTQILHSMGAVSQSLSPEEDPISQSFCKMQSKRKPEAAFSDSISLKIQMQKK